MELKKFECVLEGGQVIKGRFTEGKFDKDYKVPKGYKKYSIRHADDDWTQPETIEDFVIVNHFGDLITKTDIIMTRMFVAKPYIEIKEWINKGNKKYEREMRK